MSDIEGFDGGLANNTICRTSRRTRKGLNGPTIAWFKDPAGNIVSVIEQTAAP
jgi:hypothetical protein